MNSSNPNEQSNSPRDSRNPGNTSGMTCNSPVNAGPVKQVDHVALEGSNAPNNFVEGESQDFSTAQFQSQPGPRGETKKGA